MINWETIKSLYNDKPTLMEWLKKVEAALNGATLTSVSVNTISVGVISLTFDFDDGTSITTPNINLPQGAQGVSVTGASIVAGKLILTLSNGTTIDAGNTGAVLGFEIDNSQHLIVKYQDGTSEDLGAIFTGNVNITGNLSVGGSITNTLLNNTENVLNGAADVNGYYANEGDLSLVSNFPSFVINYAHWRVSNGKLSIVVLATHDGSEEIPQGSALTASYPFYPPAWVMNKIALTSSPARRVDTKVIESLFKEDSNGALFITPAIQKLIFTLVKTWQNYFELRSISLNENNLPNDNCFRYFRYEANFIL